MTRFETEVHEMMQYYGVTEKEAELKAVVRWLSFWKQRDL